MNVSIPRRSKICVTGNEDSGDISFLLSLCGETYITKGSIKYHGKIVYQDEDDTTYLVGSSLRDNILMGTVMIKERYNKVLTTVGLKVDDFQGGDQVEILENAKNLSNSERRNMLLARSLYSSGDIYILVDFFGHADQEIETKVYQRMVTGLLKYKTVIIKCDNSYILSEADMIIGFKKGRMKTFQTYESYAKSFGKRETSTHSSS
jgi:ABC-type transport system involved in cytochrome bd biosynthesis fused ATPase/permease subunit